MMGNGTLPNFYPLMNNVVRSVYIQYDVCKSKILWRFEINKYLKIKQFHNQEGELRGVAIK